MTDARQLWTDWTALWNGDLDIAEKLVTADFQVHFGRDIPTADELRGPYELAKFIGDFRARYENLTYRTVVGPIVDAAGGYVTGHWVADFLKDNAAERKPGIDILRIDGDRVAQAWSITGTRSLP
ncbi:hypothetical protein GCM10009765_18030 [Fodinicola feengrottensis]|uniref:SnoaL-like domain-containing protein n=1 Tax=Fodinicola feengrottensis TaxID=435914 RepID=A0ABP4SG19_9ACTN